MPPRCVLNRLQTEPIPEESSKLAVLSRQLIQQAHSFKQQFVWEHIQLKFQYIIH